MAPRPAEDELSNYEAFQMKYRMLSLCLFLLLLFCFVFIPEGMALENFVNFLGGDNKCEGQVRLQYGGQWGLMCADGLGMQEATVICRELGCGSVKTLPRYILTPEEMRQPWLYDAQCHGEEPTFFECLLGSWGPVSGCKCQCVAVIICSGRLDGDPELLSP